MKHKWILLIVAGVILLNGCVSKDDFPVLKGSYLGQTPPGMIPEIFAPYIIRNCPSFTLDGKDLYFR